MDKCEIRPAIEADYDFIIPTFLKSYYSTSYFAKPLRWHVYEPHQRAVINKLLARPDARILVAHAIGIPELILGWLLYEPTVFHYVYTKLAFHHFGVATKLIEHTAIDPNTAYFSHWTQDISAIAPWKKWPGLTFNPYLAWELPYE